MNKLGLLVAGFAFSMVATAQSFEGSIEFRMETPKDTTTNIYYVRGNDVKLDQIGKKSGKVEGSFVFDLTNNQVKFVNPVRKVWGEHKSETPPATKGQCVASKGSGTKTVQNMKCTEYTVKNTDENTIVTYWVTSGKYDFFIPLVKLWNRKDRQSIYFNQIKDLPKGAMPLLSEERQISDNKLLSKLEVTKLSKGSIDASKVAVPADYKKFEQK